MSRLINTTHTELDDVEGKVVPGAARDGARLAPDAAALVDNHDVTGTGPSQQDDDGTVWVDYSKCMGCKVCVNACPYGMRDVSHSCSGTSNGASAPG